MLGSSSQILKVEIALRANPKSYGAWYHRKWVLSQGLAEVDFDREFRLLDQLLKADSRNFHGWNYRRWCISHALFVSLDFNYLLRLFSSCFGTLGLLPSWRVCLRWKSWSSLWIWLTPILVIILPGTVGGIDIIGILSILVVFFK